MPGPAQKLRGAEVIGQEHGRARLLLQRAGRGAVQFCQYPVAQIA